MRREERIPLVLLVMFAVSIGAIILSILLAIVALALNRLLGLTTTAQNVVFKEKVQEKQQHTTYAQRRVRRIEGEGKAEEGRREEAGEKVADEGEGEESNEE